MPFTPNALLDLSDLSVGQVMDGVRFEVVDRTTLDGIGSLDTLAATAVAFNGDSAVKRTLAGVRIAENVLRDVNPFSDLVRPWWVCGDGTEWPLGAFTFADLPRRVMSGMNTLDATMMDQASWFQAETGRTFSVGPKSRIIDLVSNVLDYYSIPYTARLIPHSLDTRALDPIGYTATATANQIFGRAAQLLGCLPPYFDNLGRFVMREPPDVGHTDPDTVYTLNNSRIIAGTIIENDNLLDAPNLFRVVGAGPASASLSGEATVDPDLPFSIEARGRVVAKTIEIQGLSSTQQATDIASANAAAVGGYRTWEFDAFPDPRHDGFNLVGVDGGTYRELAWELKLAAGGPHHHVLTAGGFPAAG